jgi:predicted RNA binding protein YcfA (HicA-like mRNA interferase family)
MKVRDVVRRLRAEGFVHKRTRGDHRTVIVAGHDSDDVRPGTWNAIQKQAGWK